MNVVITSGGSWEKIDSVRSICNFSSGKTGSTLCDYKTKNRFKICFIYNKISLTPKYTPYKKIPFVYFNELEKEIDVILKNVKIDLFIHLAAVSDYRVEKILCDGKILDRSKKIKSSKKINLELLPNPKLVEKIKKFNKTIFLVAFKLYTTDTLDKRKMNKLFNKSGANLIVTNNLLDISLNSYRGKIYKRETFLQIVNSREDLAESLMKIFKRDKDYE